MSDTPPSPHKSGFVAVMGRPNVGKSMLINALLGQKVAAVSPKPQTTRKRQLGILSLANAQIIFMDTPGLHNPYHKLGESMNQQAEEALLDSDLILPVVDLSAPFNEEDQKLANLLDSSPNIAAILLVMNKADLVGEELRKERESVYRAQFPHNKALTVSAATGLNLDNLIQQMVNDLPEGPRYYPEDQTTDLYEREIAADLVREAALIHLRDEVPHGIAVRIDEYKDRGEQGAFIAITLFVERETHRGIVIGQGGAMLKQIGTTARQEIEAMSGRQVYLQLRVKVRKNWRSNEKALSSFGFSTSKKPV